MPPKRPLDDPSAARQSSRPPPPMNFTKARACEACRKHKIKCEWSGQKSICVKCERSGFECVVTDGTQRFLEEDIAWKNDAKVQIQELQSAVARILQVTQLPELSTFRQSQGSPPGLPPVPKEVPHPLGTSPSIVVPSIDMTRENSQEPQTEQAEIVPAPMKSLYTLTRLHVLGTSSGKAHHSSIEDDFISRGVMSVQEAEELFAHYSDHMNQYLWAGIILLHDTLLSCRQSSSMLCAVILTVAAIHLPNKSKETMEKCYSEFVSIVCASALSRRHSLDDIRALILGAFYLPTLSWKLSGQAVRIATEMNLHRSFQSSKMTLSQVPGDHERARLWCMLYVCDCQFSIAYGRPPVTIQDATIKNYEKFLEGPKAIPVPGDIRLSAQVILFRVLTEAYEKFGTDMDQILEEEDFTYLRRFNGAVEEWRVSWERRSNDSPHVGSYPSLIIVLYYYFAKFQINSLAFRGIGLLPNSSMNVERKEAANASIAACLSTLTLITDQPDMRSALPFIPIFTHTMIAFSATFLLQVAARWSNSNALSIDARHVLNQVSRVANLMDEVKYTVGETHLTRHIARGLKKLLDNFRILDGGEQSTTKATPMPAQEGNTPYGAVQYAPQPPGFDGRVMEFQGYAGDAATNGISPENWPFMMNDVRGTYGFGFDEQMLNPFVADQSSWY